MIILILLGHGYARQEDGIKPYDEKFYLLMLAYIFLLGRAMYRIVEFSGVNERPHEFVLSLLYLEEFVDIEKEQLDHEVLKLYNVYPIDELEYFLDSEGHPKNSTERKNAGQKWVLDRNKEDRKFVEDRKKFHEKKKQFLSKINQARFSEKYELKLKSQ